MKRSGMHFALLAVFVCCAAHIAYASAPKSEPQMPFVAAASIGAIVVSVLSSPAFASLMAGVAVAIYNKVMKANESAYRWQRVASIAQEIVIELKDSGWNDYGKLVARAMALLVEQTTADKSIKSLTEKEVEEVKPIVIAYAKRAMGKVEVPMAPVADSHPPNGKR